MVLTSTRFTIIDVAKKKTITSIAAVDPPLRQLAVYAFMISFYTYTELNSPVLRQPSSKVLYRTKNRILSPSQLVHSFVMSTVLTGFAESPLIYMCVCVREIMGHFDLKSVLRNIYLHNIERLTIFSFSSL